MAATQRPLRDVALVDASGPPAWRRLPSWLLLAELDRNIPLAVHRLMAQAANPVGTVEVPGSSHAISHPAETVAIIRAAVEHLSS